MLSISLAVELPSTFSYVIGAVRIRVHAPFRLRLWNICKACACQNMYAPCHDMGCCVLTGRRGCVGQLIMVVGVVVPIGWFVLKNKHSVQSAWTNIGNKRPH